MASDEGRLTAEELMKAAKESQTGCLEGEDCCYDSVVAMLPTIEAHVARREREAAARALREAADDIPTQVTGASTAVYSWLRARADRVAAGDEEGTHHGH